MNMEMLTDNEFVRIYRDQARTPLEIELFRRLEDAILQAESLFDELRSCGPED